MRIVSGIAHLADDDDVGRLTQRRAQRGRKIGRVDADLDLLDDAAAVRVLVLDRILDRDDVARVAAVDLLDQRRQRRRLPGAGRSADQHQPARQLREQLDLRRQLEGGEPRHPRGAGSRRRPPPAPLPVQVDAKASEAGRSERRVGDLRSRY